MTKTELELLCRQQEIVKLIDFFILSDNNNDDEWVLGSISQNGKWISRVLSKELEVEAEKWNMILCERWLEKYYLWQSIIKETNFLDSCFLLQMMLLLDLKKSLSLIDENPSPDFMLLHGHPSPTFAWEKEEK